MHTRLPNIVDELFASPIIKQNLQSMRGRGGGSGGELTVGKPLHVLQVDVP